MGTKYEISISLTFHLQQVFLAMSSDNLIERIRARSKLTPSEARIADFFSRHYPETVFENVTSISQKTGVSKATVVRFISKLGYASFSQFHNMLQQEVICEFESPGKRFTLKKKQTTADAQDVLGENFSYIINNLQHTHSQIDPEKFKKVARMIAESKGNLYIMGQRTSYALGYLFHVLLKYLRANTFLLDTQASILPDLLVDVADKDLLFAISHRRYARATLKVAQYFKEKKARILLLTDSDFSPLSHLAYIQLVVPSDGLSIFYSYCAMTALLESLVIAALPYCDENVYGRFDKAEKLLNDFETFCPGRIVAPNPGREIKK